MTQPDERFAWVFLDEDDVEPTEEDLRRLEGEMPHLLTPSREETELERIGAEYVHRLEQYRSILSRFVEHSTLDTEIEIFSRLKRIANDLETQIAHLGRIKRGMTKLTLDQVGRMVRVLEQAWEDTLMQLSESIRNNITSLTRDESISDEWL